MFYFWIALSITSEKSSCTGYREQNGSSEQDCQRRTECGLFFVSFFEPDKGNVNIYLRHCALCGRGVFLMPRLQT